MGVYSKQPAGRNRSLRLALTRWSPRTAAFILLLALGFQFLLGMLTNFYVTIPDVHPGSQASNYFVGVLQGEWWVFAGSLSWLQLHAELGFLVFLGAIALLVRAIALRSRAWIILASLGLAGIIGAGFNGASFMNYGHDLSSLIMSATFLLALIAYLVGLYIRD